LNPGWTPLVKADNLGRELGFTAPLHVKDDSGNPTHSFKDRVVACAIEAARAFGYTTLSCSSTGNLAGAVGAAAARAGFRSCVFIPHDLEQGKVVMAGVYGGELVGIEGNYDDVNRFCSELIGDPAGEGWGFVNVNLRPYYGEGSKTLAYEICEQLGWRLPEQIVIPIASGSQLTKIDKGLQELIRLGLVEDRPYKVFGAQAEGCSPVSAAFKAGRDVIKPVKPDTIAKSLAIGNPADGPYVLDIARRTGGAVEDVTDAEVVAAIRLLARTEGIFAETAGGVTVGVLKKLVETGQLDPAKETVAINTGDGLKTLDADADAGMSAVIRPTLDSFRAAGLASA
jgi:threonine synthase